LVFDFQDTINLLGRTGSSIDQGVIRGVNVVQSGQRTRLILNLRQRVTHQAEMEGNVLLITLVAPTSADPVTPVAVAPAPSARAEVTAVLSIAQYGSTRSINAGAAAAIAMHAWVRRHAFGQVPSS
jgi:hypothetical protein